MTNNRTVPSATSLLAVIGDIGLSERDLVGILYQHQSRLADRHLLEVGMSIEDFCRTAAIGLRSPLNEPPEVGERYLETAARYDQQADEIHDRTADAAITAGEQAAKDGEILPEDCPFASDHPLCDRWFFGYSRECERQEEQRDDAAEQRRDAKRDEKRCRGCA